MQKLLPLVCFLFAVVFAFLDFPNGALTVLVLSAMTMVLIVIVRRTIPDDRFIINVFLGALLARLFLGGIIYYFDLFKFFGPDALTYDELGYLISEYWKGNPINSTDIVERSLRVSGPGWGMNYLAGSLNFLFGKGILLGQSFCGFFGAAITIPVYVCANAIYNNRRVAKISALLVAFFPSFIVWTAQYLKDGLIIFFIVLSIAMVIQIQRKFSFVYVLIISLSLISILSLRFYIVFMVSAAIVGCFVIGMRGTQTSIFGRLVALALIGLLVTYLGAVRTATLDVENFATVDRLQISRRGAGVGTGSGFIDSNSASADTPLGIIAALPIGFAYLIFAPFPWQAANFRQATTIPETLLWWSSIPFVIWGLWFTTRNRLRESIPAVVFTLLLTLVYSVYQGNVGTAYRQRTQIQVFLLMFAAVGVTIYLEGREDKRALRRIRR